MIYAVLSYLIGVIGLAACILAVGNLHPGIHIAKASPGLWSSLLVDTLLITLFALQHSIMARQGFKQWLTRFIPIYAERATYVLLSGILLLMAVTLWMPLPGEAWNVQSQPLNTLLWIGFAFGWGYLLIATFLTNHFELFGLRQAYLNLMAKPYTSLPFTQRGMYNYSRHPMMAGVLIGVWCHPQMSFTQLCLAATLTIYVFAGIWFEERDLEKNFGSTYKDYKQKIGTFITPPRKS